MKDSYDAAKPEGYEETEYSACIRPRRTIKEWQEAAHAHAVAKGFHSRICPECDTRPQGQVSDCTTCGGRGYQDVDPFSDTRIGSRLALIHCEISEAAECVARERMALYWVCPKVSRGNRLEVTTMDTDRYLRAGWKPEGFGIELADVFLRLCDFAESLGLSMDACSPTSDESFDSSNPEHIACALAELHDTVAAACGHVSYAAQYVLQHLTDIAAGCGVDLLAMAEIKHAYNLTRPIMHGGKVL